MKFMGVMSATTPAGRYGFFQYEWPSTIWGMTSPIMALSALPPMWSAARLASQ
ncbi:hypothetical protein D3C87_2106190 [compost metagenome]